MAGLSSVSNTVRREPGNFLKGRALSSSKSVWMAAFSSGSEKQLGWRNRARIQRSTNCTPASTFALSRGRRTRAGKMAVP